MVKSYSKWRKKCWNLLNVSGEIPLFPYEIPMKSAADRCYGFHMFSPFPPPPLWSVLHRNSVMQPRHPDDVINEPTGLEEIGSENEWYTSKSDQTCNFMGETSEHEILDSILVTFTVTIKTSEKHSILSDWKWLAGLFSNKSILHPGLTHLVPYLLHRTRTLVSNHGQFWISYAKKQKQHL